MPAMRVAAVRLGGSAARGHADRFSDLELFLAWTEPPTDEDRAAAIAAAGGDLVMLYPVEDGVWSDSWKIGRRDGVPFTGIEVDMSHCLVETVESIVRDVVEGSDPDPAKQLAVGGILHSIPLHGRALVERWQQRAAHYPTGFASPSSVPMRRSKASGGSMLTQPATIRSPATRC